MGTLQASSSLVETEIHGNVDCPQKQACQRMFQGTLQVNHWIFFVFQHTTKCSHLVGAPMFCVTSLSSSFFHCLLYLWLEKLYVHSWKSFQKTKGKCTNFTFVEQVNLLVLAVKHCAVVLTAGKIVVTPALVYLTLATHTHTGAFEQMERSKSGREWLENWKTCRNYFMQELLGANLCSSLGGSSDHKCFNLIYRHVT